MQKLGHRLGRVLRFVKDKSGVSAVEYALIAVAVIAIVGVGVATMGTAFKGMFVEASVQLSKAQVKATPP
ncbi:MAG: Flp family type IVb pilin [Acidobacteria bacterium]|nr:Flp family type IVb pilin [Acidobacteriota bacterium]